MAGASDEQLPDEQPGDHCDILSPTIGTGVVVHDWHPENKAIASSPAKG